MVVPDRTYFLSPTKGYDRMGPMLVNNRSADTTPLVYEPSISTEVRRGLSAPRKHLPSSLLYDERGSSLFVQITQQPEYQLTNWEVALLTRHGAEIAKLFSSAFSRFYEFGAGCFSEKQDVLLSALRNAEKKVIYCPIDICKESVDNVVHAFRKRYHQPLGIEPIIAEYGAAMIRIRQNRMRDARPQFFFLPGANIGNFSDSEALHFMRSVGYVMGTTDHLMIGFDLVKDVPEMLAAYDDAAGVTRAFNLNLLERLNRECGADFELNAFTHHPFYDETERSMKSELISMKEQVVSFSEMPDFTASFAAGETIAVERSRKYDLREIRSLATRAGLRVSSTFTNGQYADVVFMRAT